MNKKDNYTFPAVAAVCVFLSFLHCPWFDLFYDDKEIFKYTGFVIYKGGIPYRDFFDHKPPFIFFLNYYGLLLGSWGLWLIDTFLALFASLFFLQVCKKNKMAWPWLLPVLFNLLIRQSMVSFGIGMTREYTAIILLISFCVIMSDTRYKYYLLGLLSAFTFFTQQDQLIPLLPFIGYSLFKDLLYNDTLFKGTGQAGILPFYPTLSKRVLAMGGGFLTVTSLVISYFYLHQSLSWFWKDAFLFNFSWYTKKNTLGEHIVAIKQALLQCELDLIFYVSMILGVCSLFFRKRKPLLLPTALLCVVFSFSSEFLSGRLSWGPDFFYYLMPLSASLPILLFTVFAFTDEPFLQNKKSQLVFGIIFCFSLFFSTLRYTLHLSGHHADYVQRSPEFQYLSQQHLGDYQLYVFYNSSYVRAYNQFRILSPSPWIYHYFWNWYPLWDAHTEILKSITADLQTHRTKYILDFSDTATFRNKQHYAFWKNFLQQNYIPLNPEKPLLWKIR